MEVEVSAEAKDKRLNNLVAVTVVVLSVATGLGNIKDGNIHFHVRAGSHAAPDWYESEGEKITPMVDDLVTAAGGSISAEHGIGQLKRDELERLAPPGRIHALRAIKHALDPLGIMNPGKLI